MSQIITNLTSLPSYRLGVSGRFRAILRDLMGRPVQDTGWFDNLILDSGIPLMNNGNWFWRMYIGSNGTASDVSMTGIQTFLAQAQGSTNVQGAGVFPNYEANGISSVRFIENVGTGIIREFGIGLSNDNSGSQCVARQVVTPEINKGVDNVLDLYYDFTIWPPTGDSLANGVLIGTETYNTVTRTANIEDALYIYRAFGIAISSYYYLFDGVIGTITGSPTGTSDTSASLETYGTLTQNGSEWYRDVTYLTDINNANFPTGVSAALVRHNSNQYYQTSFKADGNGTLPVDSPIPKNDTNEIDLTYRTYWGRKV